MYNCLTTQETAILSSQGLEIVYPVGPKYKEGWLFVEIRHMEMSPLNIKIEDEWRNLIAKHLSDASCFEVRFNNMLRFNTQSA